MPAKRSPYQTLGLEPGATPDQVRRAFRKLALLYHPDRNPAVDAARRFADIREAYELLRDPERRAAYDQEIRGAEPQVRYVQAPTGPRHADPVSSVEPVARIALLFSRGRFAEAEELARDVLDENPRVATAWAVLADIARSRGEYPKALNYYARAVQAEPRNATYQQKYEALLQRTGATTHAGAKPSPKSAAAMAVAFAVICVASVYVAVSPEPSAFGGVAPISSWTVGLFVMLFVVGIALGSGLVLGGVIDRFQDASALGATRISPALVLSGIAMVNFWLAAVVYAVLGSVQGALNNSLSRLFLGCAAGLTFLTLASFASAACSPGQVVTWGGNVVYLGALCGWMVCDALRPAS